MDMNDKLQEYIKVSPEVKEALSDNQPVVAFESTLIAHGFPYPQNYKLALELEEQARAAGVIPATIAILNGEIKVGLSREEIKHIATSGNIYKASLRDLPVLVAKGMNGGTTVATTMQVAEMVGIKVFVTGGIGGVHLNGENTMDVSADLEALARYRVVVVCAGAKSVLDLARTRERLETLGVPVLGYRFDKFPAFYLRDSGLDVDYRVNNPGEVIDIMRVKEQLNIPGGLVVTTPVPEEYELNAGTYNQILEELIEETEVKKISGKDVTPYLLKRLKEETGGVSVESNIALIKNNLSVGCQIANSFKEV